MTRCFRNRIEAGRLLAGALRHHAGQPDVVVLGLPRGGVPVAFEVARELGAPLDVFLVRKLGVPQHEELAMGAIASGGARVVNQSIVAGFGISEAVMAKVAARETHELARREHLFRGHRPPLPVKDRTVILVDDGIATGATMRAAIAALRLRQARSIVVATPTAAPDTAASLRDEADEFVALLTPSDFAGVGQWYHDFAQTTDQEVCDLLDRAASAPAPRAG
jgi:putative phosphoribosyl transferase